MATGQTGDSVPVSKDEPSVAPWVPMHEPPHPMHRELERRFAATADASQRLPHVTRFAVIFYAGLAMWAIVGAGVYLVLR